MICPICGHRVDDDDYWWNDRCLRCALEGNQGGTSIYNASIQN